MEKSLYPPEPPPSYDSLPGIVQQQPSAPPPPVMPMQGMSRMPGLSEMPGMSGMPPAQILWMTRPLGRVTCPRGLEYLNQLNKLFIHQEIDNSPGGMYDESAYWYKIMNANGQQVFAAIEDPSNTSGTCVCLPGQRGYNVRIKDNINNEVMRVSRDPICCSCCPCLGCEHVVKIEAPVGQVIGYFKSQKGCGSITFTISDAGDQVVFIIKFPACATSSYLQAQEYQFTTTQQVHYRYVSTAPVTKNLTMYCNVSNEYGGTEVKYPVGCFPPSFSINFTIKPREDWTWVLDIGNSSRGSSNWNIHHLPVIRILEPGNIVCGSFSGNIQHLLEKMVLDLDYSVCGSFTGNLPHLLENMVLDIGYRFIGCFNGNIHLLEQM